MLAASMIMIKKVHEEEPTALFSLMFILSLSGAIVLIVPSLILILITFILPLSPIGD